MPQFWKIRNILFWVGRALQNSPKKQGKFPPHSFSHLRWFDVPPMLRVLRYHQPFRGPIRLTNYNFHAHVHYCITIQYHSCSIDKYSNVEGPQCVCMVGGGMSEPRSIWPKLVLQLSTRCLYFVVHLSSDQLDKSYFYCCPPDASTRGYILVQINWTKLTTRRSAWCKGWSNVKLT